MKDKAKYILYGLIVLTIVGDVLGMTALVLGRWDALEWRLLGTAITISGMGLCALSCQALLKRGKWRALSLSGLAFSVIGAGLMLGALWFTIKDDVYLTLATATLALAVVAAFFALLGLIPRSKKRALLISVGVFIVYTLVSGGGYVMEKTDSLSTMDGVAQAQLTNEVKMWLAETPTTTGFYIPFVFYYVRESYPFHLRYYGSTPNEYYDVTDEKRLAFIKKMWQYSPDYATAIVVTEVLYHRQTDDPQDANPPEVFTVASWSDIVITEPGEWVVESTGYEAKKNGAIRPLTFPTMTIHPTINGEVIIWRAISYWVAGIMSVT